MTAYIRTQHKQPWLWRHRFGFTAAATITAACLYLLFYGLGLAPQALQNQPEQTARAQTSTSSQASIQDLESAPTRPEHELPNRVTVPSVGIDAEISNPASRQIGILNSYLNQGAVRYPQSGYPGNGNLFLFGHSTGRQTVWNQAYKTFNNLEDVTEGDEIVVHTDAGDFYYEVHTKELKENSHAYVPLEVDKDMLTISTCDSFGSKEDRIVVRADFTDFAPSAQ